MKIKPEEKDRRYNSCCQEELNQDREASKMRGETQIQQEEELPTGVAQGLLCGIDDCRS